MNRLLAIATSLGLVVACVVPPTAPGCGETCSGCCDANGVCLVEARHWAAGCYVETADAGSPTGCEVASFSGGFTVFSTYAPGSFLVSVVEPFDADAGNLSLAMLFEDGGTSPGEARLTAGSLFGPTWLARYGEACSRDPGGRRAGECARQFGAISGRVGFSAFTGDADGGTYEALASGVTFVELSYDAGVTWRTPGGRCVEVRALPWVGRWP